MDEIKFQLKLLFFAIPGVAWLFEHVFVPMFLVSNHLNTKLSLEEKEFIESYIRELTRKIRPTGRKTFVIAMIGAVGDGKSHVASKLAERFDVPVVSANMIRVELRRLGLAYDHVRAIVEAVVNHLLWRNVSAVIDSDFSDPMKRASLRVLARARDRKLEPTFVRVISKPDIAIGRILTADYSLEPLYKGARGDWPDEETRPAVIKMRERERQLGLHYWGFFGKLVPRSFRFRHIVINNSHGEDLPEEEFLKVAHELGAP